MRKIIFVLVVQFTLAFSIIFDDNGVPIVRKPNMTGFLGILKNSPLRLLSDVPKRKVKEDSAFQRLQTAYFNRQQALYSESRSLSGSIKDGIDDVMSSCASCAVNANGRERTQCYSSCMTKKMDSFSSYAIQIGDTVENLFCVPLGFGFERQYASKYPEWLMSFDNFVTMFRDEMDSFSAALLLETWMSNLLWLDKSPLYLYSYIRSQVALNIANQQNSSTSSSLGPVESAGKFAAKCGNQWDLREPVYSLINAAKQKSHFLDAILPGLFAVRGAAFYTRGNFLNLAGGIMEALTTFIGRKCDIITYSDGGDVSENSCDGIGKFPIPQFPVPLAFSNLLSPCGEDSLTVKPAVV